MMADLSHLGGWVDDQQAVERVLGNLPYPVFGQAAPNLMGDDPKTVLLYKAWKDSGVGYPRDPAQVIGCCVSRGWATGIDLLSSIEVAVGKENEVPKWTSHEAIYGMSRIDIGKGQIRGDGSVGAWAAKAVNTLGTVSREVVGAYSDDRAKQWGDRGVPADIKAKAVDHKVRTVSLVSTWEELEAAIANGYPVAVCSDQGFTMTRDAQGFCRASGTWNHCMLVCAIRADRPGACILQSWGPETPSGPLALDQPPCTFWAEKAVVARMLAQRDTFAMSGFDGYPGLIIPKSWTYAGLA